MTDKTKDEVIAEILQKTLETAQKAGDFVVEQTPDLIQQLMLYKTMEYGVFTTIGLVVMLTGLWYLREAVRASNYSQYPSGSPLHTKYHNKYGKGWDEWGWPVGVLILGAGAAVFLLFAFSFAKITLAPKVWLLEYTASLLK